MGFVAGCIARRRADFVAYRAAMHLGCISPTPHRRRLYASRRCTVYRHGRHDDAAIAFPFFSLRAISLRFQRGLAERAFDAEIFCWRRDARPATLATARRDITFVASGEFRPFSVIAWLVLKMLSAASVIRAARRVDRPRHHCLGLRRFSVSLRCLFSTQFSLERLSCPSVPRESDFLSLGLAFSLMIAGVSSRKSQVAFYRQGLRPRWLVQFDGVTPNFKTAAGAALMRVAMSPLEQARRSHVSSKRRKISLHYAAFFDAEGCSFDAVLLSSQVDLSLSSI